MAGKGRIENLRPPWKPGESGNPNGRPKVRPISDRYNSYVEMLLPENLRLERGLWKGATYADAVVMRVINGAIGGDCRAAREVREGTEGKSNRREETTVAKDYTFRVEYEDPPNEPPDIPNGESSVPKTSQDAENVSSVPNTSQDAKKDSK